VRRHTKVVDDCSASVEPFLTRSGKCSTSTITVTAEDTCGNSAERIIPVQIDDGKPPVVSCGFVDIVPCYPGTTGPCIGPNRVCYPYTTGTTTCPYYATLRSENITKLKVWNPLIQGAEQLEDVRFLYNASDACGGDVDVRVDVFTNELEDYHDPHQALLYQNAKPNDAADLMLSAAICIANTNEDGQCIKDPTNRDIRIYTVEVVATDSCGLSAKDTCRMVIIPLYTSISSYNLTASSQRFHLQTYSSTFKGTPALV